MGLKLVASNDDVRQEAQRPPVLSVKLDGMAYGSRSVLGAMSLTLGAGETLALTGPSGIGKSTLVRIIAGLETAYRGEVVRPEQIGMVFQEPTLMPWRSNRENLTLTTGVSDAGADKALEEVGLGRRGSEFPRQLSLGQQRRLALARAFCGSPTLLLLDEPFVSLDPSLAAEMMSLFEELRRRRNIATLIVTHSAEEATRLADRILRLDGSPAQIVQG
ncbi:ABC transporter ATP-binding protein [Donghicola sp. XS_ASV15]|uniref:ABC transporter ATP-binding protein n=1 Tax=Donghicola sp. XS_ASV15 TaxID=3241295 RepID=UPI003516597A